MPTVTDVYSPVRTWTTVRTGQCIKDTTELPTGRTREAGRDGALGKEVRGHQSEGKQDRVPPASVAAACSNYYGQSRSAAGQWTNKSHVKHYAVRIGLIF